MGERKYEYPIGGYYTTEKEPSNEAQALQAIAERLEAMVSIFDGVVEEIREEDRAGRR